MKPAESDLPVPDLPLDDRTIAYHEAGHVVAYLMAGWTGIYAEMPDHADQQNPSSGATWKPGADARERIRLRMGSLVVEQDILGLTAFTAGSRTDRLQICQLLETISDIPEERQAACEALWEETEAAFAMSDVRATVRAIAEELLARRHLNDADIRRLAAVAGLQTTLPMRTP